MPRAVVYAVFANAWRLTDVVVLEVDCVHHGDLGWVTGACIDPGDGDFGERYTVEHASCYQGPEMVQGCHHRLSLYIGDPDAV